MELMKNIMEIKTLSDTHQTISPFTIFGIKQK